MAGEHWEEEPEYFNIIALTVVFYCVEHITLVDKMTIYGFWSTSTNLLRNYIQLHSNCIDILHHKSIQQENHKPKN